MSTNAELFADLKTEVDILPTLDPQRFFVRLPIIQRIIEQIKERFPATGKAAETWLNELRHKMIMENSKRK
jgi:hypothetical protein